VWGNLRARRHRQRARSHLQVPEPRRPSKLRWWASKLHALWSKAHRLPATIRACSPQIADLYKKAIASGRRDRRVGAAYLASFIVAGIIMAFGRSGAAGMRLFRSDRGNERGASSPTLHVRPSARWRKGFLGGAADPGDRLGLLLSSAAFRSRVCSRAIVLSWGCPVAGMIVTPAGDRLHLCEPRLQQPGWRSRTPCCSRPAGMLATVLKPLLLDAGVEGADCPVILLSALGGWRAAASSHVLGATFLALGTRFFMAGSMPIPTRRAAATEGGRE
jgi:hypothetical protein